MAAKRPWTQSGHGRKAAMVAKRPRKKNKKLKNEKIIGQCGFWFCSYANEWKKNEVPCSLLYGT